MLCPNLCKNFKAGDICVLLSLYIYLADTIAPENLRNSANLVSPQIIIHKNFHDFGFDVGRPISTLPPKCIALFWKTLDLQNMHQFLPTSEPIRLHQNTNSSDCCLYMYKFNCDSTPFPSRVTFILKGMMYLSYLTFPERHALSSILLLIFHKSFSLSFSLSFSEKKIPTNMLWTKFFICLCLYFMPGTQNEIQKVLLL